MSATSSRPLARLVRNYARPCWKPLTGLVALTVVANLLVVLQPILLAAILAQLLGTASAASPSGGWFDLNALGIRCLAWLRLSGSDPNTTLLALGALYLAQSAAASWLGYWAHLVALRVRTRVRRRKCLVEQDIRLVERVATKSDYRTWHIR